MDPEDPTAPDTTGDAPGTDTAQPETTDTAPDTPAAPAVDYESRYKAQQAELTRKSMLLAEQERRIAELTADGDEDDEASDGDAPKSRPRESQALVTERERREQAEWTLAQSVYGPEVIGVYETAIELFNAAVTAADFVAAFEAYHQARLGGAIPAQAAAPAAPAAPAVPGAPAVLSDRPDAPSATPIDPQRFAGGANGGVRGFLAQVLGDRQG